MRQARIAVLATRAVLTCVVTVIAVLASTVSASAVAGWSGWRRQASDAWLPSVASRGPGLLDLFAVGTDGHIHHQAYDGNAHSWGGWSDLGGDVTGRTDATAMGSDQVVVAAVGNDHRIYTKYWKAGTGWSPWTAQSPADAYWDVSVTSRGPGLLDLFYVTNYNVVMHRGYDASGWHAWDNLGGIDIDRVDATWIGDRLQVVARQMFPDNPSVTNHPVLARQYTLGQGWQGWSDLGGDVLHDNGDYELVGDVSVTDRGSTLEFYATGTDGALWQRTLDTSRTLWTSWTSVGGDHWSVDAVAWDQYRTDVFTGTPYSAGKAVYQNAWSAY